MPEVRIFGGDRNWNLLYRFLHGALAIPFPHFLLPLGYVLGYLYWQMNWGIRTPFFNPALGLGLESIFIMPSNLGVEWIFPLRNSEGVED
jgi:hypothetical protein